LTLRGGIFGDEVLSYDQVKALAELPSLPELRAQILGLINAPAQNIVSALTNGVRQVVNVIDAYAKSEDAAEAA
jgi:large subunit ribosomal protein L10